MNYIEIFISLLVGLMIGWLARQKMAAYLIQSAETRAKDIISKAKIKQQEVSLKTKEDALKIIDKAKKDEDVRRQELKKAEDKIGERQNLFDKKILELEENRRTLLEERNNIEDAKDKIRQIYEKARTKLEEISNLTTEEAKKLLLENIEQKMKDDILKRIKKLEDYGTEEIEKKAKNLIISVIERCAAAHTSENTTS